MKSAMTVDMDGLRNRNKPQKVNPVEASDLVGKLNAEEKAKGKDRKTFGRTDDGTIFVVPETHDMVSQLLSPIQPKNVGDLIILAILAFHIALFWYVPLCLRSWTLGIIFAMWRISYNLGIGYLLDVQSKNKRLTSLAQKWRLFVDPISSSNPRPQLFYFIKRELETKIAKDYKMEDAPVEYNTWLIFRRVVDLVLMSDFVSYSLLAISLGLGERPIEEPVWLTYTRWIGGSLLILFNIWVKLDAHRVVKDFAWYWGDVFFLIPQKLVFDGVFQMAPHPMYSVGYIGYYGIAAIAKSYPLLFASIAAHLLQFAFLFTVEMPHIEKIYPEDPEPVHRKQQTPGKTFTSHSNKTVDVSPMQLPFESYSTTQHLIGLSNIDLSRVADVLGLLIPIYSILVTVTMPSDSWTQALFVFHAWLWRMWYTGGLGLILHSESIRKVWTRHFVKHGMTADDGWCRWKEIYFVSERMVQWTFVAAACKLYKAPTSWIEDYALLKHVVGVALICLQLLVATSIYDALGEFGWFYGDFFYPRTNNKLTYNKGPYRYLNNPELFIGVAGLWGAVLLTESRMIFALTLFTHVLAFVFHYAVERPHQRRVYRGELRKESGVSMTFKPYLPAKFNDLDIDTALDTIVDKIESFLDEVAPRLISNLNDRLRSSSRFFRRLPVRYEQLNKVNPKDYNIQIVETKSEDSPLVIQYGSPIKIRWTAPVQHSSKDWIGLYSVSHNPYRNITSVSSSGRWIATNKGQYDNPAADEGHLTSNLPLPDNKDKAHGEMIFSSDKLFWQTGAYEFRYHHAGRHNVLAISQPFEIRIDHFDEDESLDINNQPVFLAAAEQALLPIVQNCFEHEPNAPKTVTDSFGLVIDKSGKYSRRTVYAITRMFGIELDAEVIKMDGSVRNIAWRIGSAKRVLAPYSMSNSRGRSTPAEEVVV